MPDCVTKDCWLCRCKYWNPSTSLLSTHACDHRRARVSSSRSFSQQPTTCSHPSPPKAKGKSPHLHAHTHPRLNQPTIHPLLSHTWPPGASHPSPVATQRGYHTCPERRITDSLPPFHRGCKRMRVDILLPPSKRNLQCISDAVPDCATKKEEKRQWWEEALRHALLTKERATPRARIPPPNECSALCRGIFYIYIFLLELCIIL